MMNEALPVMLETVLEQRALPVADRLRYALKLALALRSEHENGTFYGVLDPSRIRFTADGALIEAAAGSTGYAAPEVVSGVRPDARSDIFAFGAILYRLSTGREPFPAAAPDGIAEQAAAPMELVRDGDQEIDARHFPGLERTIVHCLESRPDRRWQTVRPICIELRLLLAAASRRGSAAKNARRTVEELVHERVSRTEAACTARVAACEQTVRDLHSLLCDRGERFSAAIAAIEDQVRSQGHTVEGLRSMVGKTDDVLEQLADSIAACNHAVVEMGRAAAETQGRAQREISSVQDRLIQHAASIDSLERSAKRTDELIEGVVESIDSIQSLVIEESGLCASRA